VHPVSGASGPSSRSIFNASLNERGCNSARPVTDDVIEYRPTSHHETAKNETTKTRDLCFL
jgi:hypothetical protein